jgi:hypothetical protein
VLDEDDLDLVSPHHWLGHVRVLGKSRVGEYVA